MAGRVVHFVPGSRWFAGVDLPFWLLRSAVTSGASDMGFRDIRWHTRDEPVPIDPKADPQYSDEWNEWAEGVYVGPERDHVLPWSIPWLGYRNPEAAVPAQVQPPPELTLEQKAMVLARTALESRDPGSIRVAAAMLSAQGFRELAAELERQAAAIEGQPTEDEGDESDTPEAAATEDDEVAEPPSREQVAGVLLGALALDIAGAFLFGWIVRRVFARKP